MGPRLAVTLAIEGGKNRIQCDACKLLFWVPPRRSGIEAGQHPEKWPRQRLDVASPGSIGVCGTLAGHPSLGQGRMRPRSCPIFGVGCWRASPSPRRRVASTIPHIPRTMCGWPGTQVCTHGCRTPPLRKTSMAQQGDGTTWCHPSAPPHFPRLLRVHARAGAYFNGLLSVRRSAPAGGPAAGASFKCAHTQCIRVFACAHSSPGSATRRL